MYQLVLCSGLMHINGMNVIEKGHFENPWNIAQYAYAGSYLEECKRCHETQ